MLHVVFSHAYFVLIPLALLEGPLLSIVCGAAAGMGALNPFIAYGILVGGDLGPDLMYYAIGRWGATMPFVRRYASRIQAIRDNFLSLEQLWRTHPLATMASAKLSYLLSPALIVSRAKRNAAAEVRVLLPYGFHRSFGRACRARLWSRQDVRLFSSLGRLGGNFPRRPGSRDPRWIRLRDDFDAPTAAPERRRAKKQSD